MRRSATRACGAAVYDEPAEAASGVHGTNERLLVRSYLQGIRVLIDLMEHANVEP